MPQIFSTAFLNAAGDDERRSLIKLFNVWGMFLNPDVLHNISQHLNLPEYVRHYKFYKFKDARLMQDPERQKISDFKRRFLPSSLPEEVRASGNFKTGSEVNYQHEMLIEQQHRASSRHGHSQQMQKPQGGMTSRQEGGVRSQKQLYETTSGQATAGGSHGHVTSSIPAL